MPLDPARTVAELKELRELTGDETARSGSPGRTRGCARRSGWPRSSKARAREMEFDEARNQWWTLPGRSERALIIGGHLDSVPNGGWLDGALERRRRLGGVQADRGRGRAGRSPCGSSAGPTRRARASAGRCSARRRPPGRWPTRTSSAAGRPRRRLAARTRSAAHGVDLDRAIEARRQLENAAAYLELHIEQGPVLESMGLAARRGARAPSASSGIAWSGAGQAAHAGSTPMDQRRDALAGAAKLALALREIAARRWATGRCAPRAASSASRGS